jgi:hypothetical protein
MDRKYSLKQLKDMTYTRLCQAYQEEDGNPLNIMRELEVVINKKNINTYVDRIALLCGIISDYHDAFFYMYNDLIAKYHDDSSRISISDIKNAEMYIGSCVLHINRLNVKYLTKSALDTAKKSISYGILSIIIGFVSLFYACYISFITGEDAKSYIQILKNSENRLIESDKKRDEQYKVLLSKLDDIVPVKKK